MPPLTLDAARWVCDSGGAGFHEHFSNDQFEF